ncbi:MAG: glycosyltransferase family 4 protein [Desulfobulbaceae bacterium]|nr:glycosyltransferase family 4 protein [Desulfobulbaceae bacterium]
MKIAVFWREQECFSLKIYREKIVSELVLKGVEIVYFSGNDSIPLQCDIVWDPGLGMRRVPRIFKKTEKPVICTVHGLRAFSLPLSEIARNMRESISTTLEKTSLKSDWSWFKKKVSAVITVSMYGKEEIVRAFAIQRDKVFPIYHGVDHNIFYVKNEQLNGVKPFFLHVSQYNPKKNVERIFAAFDLLAKPCPDLLMIIPGYKGRLVDNPGVIIDTQGVAPEELAKHFQKALCFVFPSLHETFGMPIVEAMACGCPVITSNVTACQETAGNAALLVNPRSAEKIYSAMKQRSENNELRQGLREKSIMRASMFSWTKSAEEHLQIFKRACATA